MDTTQGYVQKRRGVLEHLERGSLTLLEYGAFDFLLMSADAATGTWWGSAEDLSRACGAKDVDSRKARRLLESLEGKRYIRRFLILGSHSRYPVLLHQYFATKGAANGKVLNAWKSSSYEGLVWEWPPGDAREVSVTCPGHVREDATPLPAPSPQSQGHEKLKIETKTKAGAFSTAVVKEKGPATNHSGAPPHLGENRNAKPTPEPIHALRHDLRRSSHTGPERADEVAARVVRQLQDTARGGRDEWLHDLPR